MVSFEELHPSKIPENREGFVDKFLLAQIGRLTCDLPSQFDGQKKNKVVEGSAEKELVRMKLYNFAHNVPQTITLVDIHRSEDDPSEVKGISVEKFDRYEIGKPSSEAEPLALYNYSAEKSSSLSLVRAAIAIGRAALMARGASRFEPTMARIGTLDD